MNPFDTAWALMKAPMDYHGYSDIPHQVGDKVHDQLTDQPGKIAQDLGQQPMLGAPVSPDLMYDAYQLEDESHHGGQRFSHELTNQEEMDFQDYLMEHVPSGQGGPSDVEYRQLVDEFNRQRGNETPAFNRRFHQNPLQKAWALMKATEPKDIPLEDEEDPMRVHEEEEAAEAQRAAGEDYLTRKPSLDSHEDEDNYIDYGEKYTNLSPGEHGQVLPAPKPDVSFNPFKKAWAFLKELRPAPGVVPSEEGKPEEELKWYQHMQRMKDLHTPRGTKPRPQADLTEDLSEAPADAWMGDESPEHFDRMKEQGYPKGGPFKGPLFIDEGEQQ